jgi:hypothetical protein
MECIKKVGKGARRQAAYLKLSPLLLILNQGQPLKFERFGSEMPGTLTVDPMRGAE